MEFLSKKRKKKNDGFFVSYSRESNGQVKDPK